MKESTLRTFLARDAACRHAAMEYEMAKNDLLREAGDRNASFVIDGKIISIQTKYPFYNKTVLIETVAPLS